MLKVVGASETKTRWTLFMLAVLIIIAIFAIFFYEIPLQEDDGYYSASVLWSEKTGFRQIYWGQNNVPDSIAKGVARAYYKPDMLKTGWSTLEIQTQPDYPDWVQAYAAGLLEGSLCWQIIYWHWKNTVDTTCKDRTQFCHNMRKQLEENSKNARKQALENDGISSYWHQVNLFYTQLDGLEAGWRDGVLRSRADFDIPKIDFLWMNSGSDLKDLDYHSNSTVNEERSKPLTSIAFLKYAPNITSQFVLAHEAAGYYSEMLRLHKSYHFGYHVDGSENSSLTPGQKITFTSYPAALYSSDDFYQILGSVKLVVAGVAITNYNRSLWNETLLTEKVLMAPRVMAASRLAKNAKDWGKAISWKYSGTGNKQWLVISGTDKHENAQTTAPLTLWVIEQIPTLTISKNKTDYFRNQSFWINIGVPHYDKIRNISGYNEENNEEVLYKKKLLTSITKLLAEGSKVVKDAESMRTLMRHPELTAAGRSDVVLVNVSSGGLPNVVGDNGFSVQYHYNGETAHKGASHRSNQIVGRNSGGFHDYLKGMTDDKDAKDRVRLLENRRERSNDHSHRMNSREALIKEYAGIIDLKVSDTYEKYTGIAGPPYNQKYHVEPFSWSTSFIKNISHCGQVDTWDFQPHQPEWVW